MGVGMDGWMDGWIEAHISDIADTSLVIFQEIEYSLILHRWMSMLMSHLPASTLVYA